MMSNNLKWIDALSERYEWPEPSLMLKSKIMLRVQNAPKNKEVKESFFEYVFDLVQPKMASAIALTLVFGVCFGALTIPKHSAEAHSSLYMDSDYFFAKSLVNQHGKRGNNE